jgi:hypothetical protein
VRIILQCPRAREELFLFLKSLPLGSRVAFPHIRFWVPFSRSDFICEIDLLSPQPSKKSHNLLPRPLRSAKLQQPVLRLPARRAPSESNGVFTPIVFERRWDCAFQTRLPVVDGGAAGACLSPSSSAYAPTPLSSLAMQLLYRAHVGRDLYSKISPGFHHLRTRCAPDFSSC